MIIRIWPMTPTTASAGQAHRGAAGLVSFDRMYRDSHSEERVAAKPPRPLGWQLILRRCAFRRRSLFAGVGHPRRLTVAEVRWALLGERVHAFGLVVRGERGVENPAFEE